MHRTIFDNSAASRSECTAREQHRVFWFFLAGMLLIGIVSVYKAFFGFGGYDESFYLAVGDRLSKGDALFRDEWNLSQMIAVFVAPFLVVYKKLAGSYAGVVLYSRILYVVLHSLTCILAFNKLRGYGFMAVAGILSLFLFTPFNIMAICYNTMTLDFLVVSTLLLATSGNRKTGVFVSGVFFAFAVWCCPYLALGYAIYLVAVIAGQVAGRTKKQPILPLFGTGTFVWFTLGAACVASLLAIFVLNGTSAGDLLREIPLMLEDPEHAPQGIWDKTALYFTGIYNSRKFFKIPLAAFGTVMLAMALDRGRSKRKALYLSAAGATTLLAYFAYLPGVTSMTYNHIMYPMLFMGIASYCLLADKPRELFSTTFMGGIVYGFCVSLGSNQSFYVISSATAVANVASFVFLGKLADEIKNRPEEPVCGLRFRRLSLVLAKAVVAMLFALQLVSKLAYCFWDRPLPLLDTAIEQGPGAGIFTTKDNAGTYRTLQADISSYNSLPAARILILSDKPYLYLMLDNFGYGTLSPWLGGGETEIALDRLELYYRVHPENVPAYVYIPKASNWDFDSVLPRFEKMGYAFEEGMAGYKLEKTGTGTD